MQGNFQKFVFLAVIILATLFAKENYVSRQTASIASKSSNVDASKRGAPTFVLEPPVLALVDKGENTTAGNGISYVGSTTLPKNLDLQRELTQNPFLSSSTVAELKKYGGDKNSDTDNRYQPPKERAPDVSLESQESPSSGSFYRTGDELAPEIQARIALVANLKSGETFFSLEKNKRWPLASITKLISASIVLRDITQNQSTTIQSEDFVIDGENELLGVGERYSVKDLLRAMLLASDNEAAEALANLYGRSEFIAAMNSEAYSLGLSNTRFDDPTGLSSVNQSTAEELLKLAQQIYWNYPDIFKITRTPSVFITELNSGRHILVKNINNFAGEQDFLGGKTGYTDEASGNLLSIFSYNRKPVLIIVLGGEDRFGDTEKLLEWFKRNYK